MIKVKMIEVSSDVNANTDANIKVDWGIGDASLLAFFIERVSGSGNTTNITYCEFNLSSNIRVRSTSTQTVSITAVCLYR